MKKFFTTERKIGHESIQKNMIVPLDTNIIFAIIFTVYIS
jgi:hypothetical protein